MYLVECRLIVVVVDGELIRSNISETQKGVDLVIDIQLINHKTCEPISGVAIDLWHSNATVSFLL